MRSAVGVGAWALALCSLLTGCGGGGSSSNNGSGNPPPTGGPVSAPVVITLGGGQNASGVDIAVVGPVGTDPNAEVLGVGGNSAFNTGDQIRQGSATQVLLFGTGLSGSMQISVSGPSDISISGLQSIKATDGTPGVAFTASVSPSAALGARTVILQDANNNITTFTGGLEVIP